MQEKHLKDIKTEIEYIKKFIENKYSEQEIEELLQRNIYLPFVTSTTT